MVHGANRLASNSLLEGLVFGARSAEAMLNKHIPVDVFVPGCPPRPDAIIQGIAKAAEILSLRTAKQLGSTSAAAADSQPESAEVQP